MTCFRLLKMYKKIAVGAALGFCLAAGVVYFVYFRHPPADDILAANKARRSKGVRARARAPRPTGPDADEYYYYYYEDALDPPKKAQLKWDRFIEENNLVDIGQVYDHCEGGDKRLMIGRGVLLPDPVNGGIMTRTFVNATLDHEITGGEMKILSYYNGKELYNNVWDLCTAEEGTDEPHVIHCPIQPGTYNFKKDLPVPSYLPKGSFSSRVWAMDQDGNELGCSLSEFTI